MPAPRSGGNEAAQAASTQPPSATPVDWYESEPPLGPAASAMGTRLVRRARASWRTWVASAVLLASIVTIQRARTPPSYEVTIVLRVVEGAVDGQQMSEGEIAAQVQELAFTKDRLLELMRKHPASFPKAFTDQSLALDDFQDAMKVEVSEDDFIEDRQPTDPRRSARITLSFKSGNPELAWAVANELKVLLADSGLDRQRDRARSAVEAATVAARRAELDVSAAMRDDIPGILNKRLQAARDRLQRAQQDQAEAALASRATTERLALRFETIDPGRRPTVLSSRALIGGTFATSLFLGLLILALLAGAYDPRVLDAEDLAALGVPMLGRFPALGTARDSNVTRGAD